MVFQKLIDSDGKTYLYCEETNTLMDEQGNYIETLGAKITELTAHWDNGMITVQGAIDMSYYCWSTEVVVELYQGSLKIDTKTIKPEGDVFLVSIPYGVYDSNLNVVCTLNSRCPLTKKQYDKKTVAVIGAVPPSPPTPPPIPPEEEMKKYLLYGGLLVGGLLLGQMLAKRG